MLRLPLTAVVATKRIGIAAAAAQSHGNRRWNQSEVREEESMERFARVLDRGPAEKTVRLVAASSKVDFGHVAEIESGRREAGAPWYPLGDTFGRRSLGPRRPRRGSSKLAVSGPAKVQEGLLRRIVVLPLKP